MSLSDLNPQPLWRFFQLLCDTPRPSKQEQLLKSRIREALAEYELEIIEDQVGNLIIRKPATPGYEDAPGVVMQSHLDMVPQKNEGSTHDFSKDPIQPYIDGDWVRARGTTLGADNGIGVAAILSVLTSKDMIHGPLEGLLTVDEEAGMTGAKGLQGGVLQGSLLLNLDTEEENELYIGCAGGVDIGGRFTYQAEPRDDRRQYWRIALKGLRGGHSGLDIHSGRGNALKLVNRALDQLRKQFPALRVASLTGGTLRNAIPREAFAVVAAPAEQGEAIARRISELQQLFMQELKSAEPHLHLTISETDAADLLPEDMVDRLQRVIFACHHGVFRMSADFPGVTETSNNLARVVMDNGHIEVHCLARSLVDSLRDDAAQSLASVFELAGAETSVGNSYPGWVPDKNSRLLDNLTRLHEEVVGVVPKIQVIHAGLECGILGANYPHWDMISFGPTIRGAHSPDEAVHAPSVANFWKFLEAALAHLAKPA
ncbi:aminoacyl-histidine dipeptidase [Hahella sp. CR1]|uniref:aminoacyl-histidine dipeptidase n=1 Tax=Hahella sp. CR1 TaxID=2992807 RepID=UPI0024415533|nr:aminoacyl-histidine dipeptidase [Hahella sp. CR1]MDG9666286.1 aminoacyl-histidine dipeptidase [Hahella sp. CR1]